MTLLVLLLICFRLLPAAWLLGVDFTCPHAFQDGSNNVVSCRINRTAVIEARCLSVQSFVTFEKTVSSSTVGKCFTESFNTSSCILRDPVPDRCWCNQSDGEIFEYVFVYVASRSQDEGTKLGCEICVKPRKPLDNTASPTCKNMSFAPLISHGSSSEDGFVNPFVLIPAVLLPVLSVTFFVAGIVLLRRQQSSSNFLPRFRGKKRDRNLSTRPVPGSELDETVAFRKV